MAEAKNKDAAAPAAKPKSKRSGGLRFVAAMILAGAVLPLGMPTLLVCAGLLPTLIALIADRDRHKSMAMTIGFLNLAGVFPFVLELWERGQSMAVALDIVKRPETWVVMLGSAAIGRLLIYAVPPAMAIMAVVRMESRLKTLREASERIKTTWGNDVSTNVPIEEVKRRGSA